jgi:L-ribulokinase
MQIYADVTGRPMKISRSAQTCALGSAIAATVVAGVYPGFDAAKEAMTGLKPKVYKPNAKAHAVYRKLYKHYRTLHDAFGTRQWKGNLYQVMKDLIAIRDAARK